MSYDQARYFASYAKESVRLNRAYRKAKDICAAGTLTARNG